MHDYLGTACLTLLYACAVQCFGLVLIRGVNGLPGAGSGISGS